MPPSPVAVERAVRAALEEDVARGDITTAACVPYDTTGVAIAHAREPVVVAGVEAVREVYRQLDPEVELGARAEPGARLAAGEELFRVHGRAASILTGERVALNFLQRLSGVASHARRFVDALPPGSTTRIADTRKTTPGLRALERHAVQCGGAHNHRDDLAAGVLIKDNHIAAAGGVRAAVERSAYFAPHTARLACEVDDLAALREALDAGAEVVLLDNFTDDDVREAVRIAGGRAWIEVSGGVTEARVPTLAAAGADVISVGALTHSAPAVDIGLDWLEGPGS